MGDRHLKFHETRDNLVATRVNLFERYLRDVHQVVAARLEAVREWELRFA